MKRVFKWLGLLLGGVVLVVAVAAVNVIWFKPFSIDLFFERVFMEYALDDPELLTSLRLLEQFGIDGHNERLTDVSMARTEALNDKLERDLATLRSYDREALDPDQQLSYDVLEFFLQVQAEGRPWTYHNYLVTQLGGVHTNLPDFMLNMHQVKDETGAEQYITRLQQFGVKFDQVLEQLEYRHQQGIVPPRFVIDGVLSQIDDFTAPAPRENVLVSGLADALDELEADGLNPIRKRALVNQAEMAVADVVYPAYGRLRGFFNELSRTVTDDHGVWALPDGESYYAHQVRYHTTTDMTPEQVHRIGLDEVARLEAEMNALLESQNLTAGSVGERVNRLAADPRFLYPNSSDGRKQALADFQVIIDEIDQGLAPYFSVRPEMGVEVRSIPEFKQDGAPGAYYQGPALDGSRPGVFYLNTRDMAEVPKFGMRTLAYHEAIPGHHFQIALKQELTGVPMFRKLVPFTAFSEGWALYAERLAKELGFVDDPLDDLGRLQAEMFRAVRLVVDTGIHSQRWTRQQAIDYMMEKTGMPEGDVVAEIERYFVNPGQALAYKVGMLKLLALRERAREALGADFDIREFHRVVLTQGSLPLHLVEREVEHWIAAQSGNP